MRGVDDLATMIAALVDPVIRDGIHVDYPTSQIARHVADMLVRELGLRREGFPSGAVTDPVHGSTWYRQGGHRWVTEWVADV